jgi:hypothetical protein
MGIETAALLSYAAIASTAVGAGTAIYSGIQASNTADANAEQARREADATQVAAMTQAEKIRRAGRSQVSEANAALAASGVSIGEGTPVMIGQKITENAELDAYATILSGKRKATTLNDQAAIGTWQGQASKTAGFVNAGASLLGGVAKSQKGWVGGTTGAQIVDRSSWGE